MISQDLCAQDETFHRNFERFMKCKQDYPALISFMQLFANAYGVLGLTVCCFSVVSNIMNIIILSKRWLRRPTTSILIGIATMDLCVSLSQMPILLRYYLAPAFSQSHIHISGAEAEQGISNCSRTNTVPGRCPNGAQVVGSKEYGWVCDRTDGSLSTWGVAFLYILSQCTALTSHTASVWFGVVLAVFRWWLISELSRKLNRIRQTIGLAQQSISLASTVITRSDIQLSRVCVQCGRTVFLMHGNQRLSSINSDFNQFDRCDQCVVSMEPAVKSTSDRPPCSSNISRLFCPRSRPEVDSSLGYKPRCESLTEQRIIMMPSTGTRNSDTINTRMQVINRTCCHRVDGVSLSRTNAQRLLCLVFLAVSLFLSPYYWSAHIRAAYYILIPCDPLLKWKHSVTQYDDVLNFCVDNKTHVNAILAGYMPVRKEDFILDSYNFWIVAGLGKLAPCCLIAAFGFRLIVHLRQNLSHYLTFSGHLVPTDMSTITGRHGQRKAQVIKKRLRNHRRTSRLLILVILLILPVELPTAIILIGQRYTHQGECLYVSLGDLLDWLTLVKNALTFVIYCSMSSEFRTAFCDSTKLFRTYTRSICIFCGMIRPNE